MNTFDSYQPRTTMVSACREVDENTSELVALRRENVRLRHEKANALAAAEAERAESSRLRAQNLDLANQLAAAKAANTARTYAP